MRKSLPLALAAMFCIACFHVVVNIYFPESEAKGALASLEDELLKGGAPASPQSPAPAEPTPTGQKPPSGGMSSSWFVSLAPQAAYAADGVSEEDIRNKIKGMPKVLEAYERISSRMPRVDALRDQGLVGEGNDGLLKPKGDVSDRKDQRTIDEENADRKVVIEGLAKATLQAQNLQPSGENMKQVMDSAGATFASLRREKARAGWWIQMPDGSWKKK